MSNEKVAVRINHLPSDFQAKVHNREGVMLMNNALARNMFRDAFGKLDVNRFKAALVSDSEFEGK